MKAFAKGLYQPRRHEFLKSLYLEGKELAGGDDTHHFTHLLLLLSTTRLCNDIPSGAFLPNEILANPLKAASNIESVG